MIREKLINMIVNGRMTSLESACNTLTKENTKLRARVTSLESALDKMLEMFARQWSGADEGAILRSCRAVLGDESWRK